MVDDYLQYAASLLGKCFGMLNTELLTVKGRPETNEILRETYQDVIPGYHMNKVHWNSIKVPTTELSVDDVKKMIHLSHQLVFEKLPKKTQVSLQQTTKEV